MPVDENLIDILIDILNDILTVFSAASFSTIQREETNKSTP